MHNTNAPTQFGYSVQFNEYNSVVISSPVASRFAATTIDFIDDKINDEITLINKYVEMFWKFNIENIQDVNKSKID